MSLWKRLQAVLVRLGIAGLVIAFIVGIVLAAMFALWFPEWTGFPGDPVPSGATPTPVVIYDQPRDLWDWLQLLLVPLVLAVGGYALTRSENDRAHKLQNQRETETQRLEDQRIQEARRIEEQRILEARKIEEQRTQEAQKLEAERAQDAALQA